MASGTVDETPAYAENDLDRDRVRAMTEPFFNRKENEAQAAQPPTRDPGPASTCALELSRICPTLPRGELARPCGDVFPMEPPVRTAVYGITTSRQGELISILPEFILQGK